MTDDPTLIIVNLSKFADTCVQSADLKGVTIYQKRKIYNFFSANDQSVSTYQPVLSAIINTGV